MPGGLLDKTGTAEAYRLQRSYRKEAHILRFRKKPGLKPLPGPTQTGATPILFVGDQFGRILAALEEAGLDEETNAVFTSDHGNCLGPHEEVSENVHYEESLRGTRPRSPGGTELGPWLEKTQDPWLGS